MHHDIMNIPLTLVFGHQALLHGGYNATALGSNIGGQYFFTYFKDWVCLSKRLES